MCPLTRHIAAQACQASEVALQSAHEEASAARVACSTSVAELARLQAQLQEALSAHTRLQSSAMARISALQSEVEARDGGAGEAQHAQHERPTDMNPQHGLYAHESEEMGAAPNVSEARFTRQDGDLGPRKLGGLLSRNQLGSDGNVLGSGGSPLRQQRQRQQALVGGGLRHGGARSDASVYAEQQPTEKLAHVSPLRVRRGVHRASTQQAVDRLDRELNEIDRVSTSWQLPAIGSIGRTVTLGPRSPLRVVQLSAESEGPVPSTPTKGDKMPPASVIDSSFRAERSQTPSEECPVQQHNPASAGVLQKGFGAVPYQAGLSSPMSPGGPSPGMTAELRPQRTALAELGQRSRLRFILGRGSPTLSQADSAPAMGQTVGSAPLRSLPAGDQTPGSSPLKPSIDSSVAPLYKKYVGKVAPVPARVEAASPAGIGIRSDSVSAEPGSPCFGSPSVLCDKSNERAMKMLSRESRRGSRAPDGQIFLKTGVDGKSGVLRKAGPSLLELAAMPAELCI